MNTAFTSKAKRRLAAFVAGVGSLAIAAVAVQAFAQATNDASSTSISGTVASSSPSLGASATGTASTTGMTASSTTQTSSPSALDANPSIFGAVSTGSTVNSSNTTQSQTFLNGLSGLSSSGQIAYLENQIAVLQAQVSILNSEVQAFLNNGSATTTGSGSVSTVSSGLSGTVGSTGSTTSAVSTAVIEPNGAMVRAGTTIDFTGHGFWNEEPVTVYNNGQTVATAHADGGGNFSTGSIPVSRTAGTQTYTFIGSWSGIMGSATVNVTL